ncbi:hypothetical protein V1511DRAFT_500949 [Dipodascopsis uninucleata]
MISNDALLVEAASQGTFDSQSDWPAFKEFLISKMKEASSSKFDQEETDADKKLMSELICTFTASFESGPPYTLQRLAELIQQPTSHYKVREKFLRAIERVLSVSSRLQDFPLPFISSHNELSMNGMASYSESGSKLNEMVILSPIEWLVDTGTPPPEDLSLNETGKKLTGAEDSGVIDTTEPVVNTNDSTEMNEQETEDKENKDPSDEEVSMEMVAQEE